MKTGTGVAKRILCTSENNSAEQALADGILDEIVDSLADGHKAVKNLCSRLTECAPRSVELAKELVLGVAGQQVNEQLMFYTSKMLSMANSSAEAKAATAIKSGQLNPWEVRPIQALH